MKFTFRQSLQKTVVLELPLDANIHGLRAHEVSFTAAEIRILAERPELMKRLLPLLVAKPH